MAALPHRRQVLLFLIAVLLPSVVVGGLGLRLLRQERELAEKRLVDERQRQLRETLQALEATLDSITTAQLRALRDRGSWVDRSSYADPAIALVVPIVDGRALMPWETAPTLARARRSLAQSSFARGIERGQQLEVREGNGAAAVAAYRAAAESAADTYQAAYARLMLARSLKGVRRQAEARTLYQSLLQTPNTIVDEHGMPMALYAASQLLEDGGEQRAVRAWLQRTIDAADWRSPALTYALRDLVRRIAASHSEDDSVAATSMLRLASDVEILERGLLLQREFAAMDLRAHRVASDSVPWRQFDDGAWLVTSATVPMIRTRVLLAVDTRRLIAGLRESATSPDANVSLSVGENAPGEPVAPHLSAIRAAVTVSPPVWLVSAVSLRRAFFAAALTLVLGITLYGGYLLWRDVRREVGLAEMRSQFVSSVSHELKTPLTAIRMFAETLRDGGVTDSTRREEYLDTIVGESERLTRLLNNVLDHARIERDEKLYHRQPVSLPDVVRRAADALEHPLTQGGFRLKVETPRTMPPIEVDEDAVEQAILNLLTNAMKYSGVSRDIDLRVITSNGHATIEVQDRGVGIPADQHARLTEKFYRVRSSATEGIPGTGLGLTIVEHMARAHGGHLTVRSVVGEGSTFAIHLPVQRS